MYFYAYAASQLPTGILLDSLGLALYGSIGFAIAAIGSLIVAFAPTITLVLVGRFLIGFGCGAAFISTQKFIARYLPLRLSAIATGAVLVIGNVGSLYAQYPMVFMAKSLGVRVALAHLALYLGIPALMLPILIGKDGEGSFSERLRETLRSIPKIARDKHTIGVLLSMALAYSTILLLQVIVLRDFLIDKLGLSIARASMLATAFSLGLMTGQLTVGILSDRVVKARKPFAAATHAALSISALYLLTQPGSETEAVLVALLMGLGAAGQMVTVPMAREPWPPSLAASSFSIANMSTFVAAALLQNAAPYILRGGHTRWNYPLVAATMVLLNIVGFFAVVFLTRETAKGSRRRGS